MRSSETSMVKALRRMALLGWWSCSWCFAEPAPAAPSGTIAVLEWTAPDPVLLERLGGACTLLAASGDLAVVLLPAAYTIPAGLEGLIRPLEPLDAARGDYYLFHVADAERASFAGRTRVLVRRGRTLLLRSDGGAPELTPASAALLRGIAQPLLISLDPKALPSRRDARDAKDDPPSIEFDARIADIVAAVDQAEYTEVWQALDDFDTRYTFTPQNRAAAAWIADVFASYGIEVETHVYAQDPEQKNVIGILRGRLEPAAVIYMAAHFDSTSVQATTFAPGADDNASGVAAVLEAARVLSGHAFARTIKFVAFDGEEQGMVGSGAYCRAIAAAHENVVGCFNFDMIAYAGRDAAPPDLAIYANHASLELAHVLAAACTTFVPDGVEPVVVEDGNVGWSDHAPFWSNGFKALTGIEAGAWDEMEFCPWYHTPQDRIEKYPKDYPTHVTAAAVAALAYFAVPLPPGDCNGNGILDYVELATGSAADCDMNGIPDDCDIAAGRSPDCNANGVPDACDIATGAAQDLDGDGIPDTCVPPEVFRRGDGNQDGRIDVADAVCTLGYLFGGGDACRDLVGACRDSADANDDGVVDLSDAVRILMLLFASRTPLPPPFDACGSDATDDELDCESSPSCR